MYIKQLRDLGFFISMQVWLNDASPNNMLSSQNGTLVKLTHMVHLIYLKLLLNCMTQFVTPTHCISWCYFGGVYFTRMQGGRTTRVPTASCPVRMAHC